MEKKLPKVYVNKVDKKFNNNEKVYYKKEEHTTTEEVSKTPIPNSIVEENIHQKIRKIFNSNNYIYKIDVVIKLKDKEVEKRIIGKNTNYLITYENELISIADIIDIYVKEK